MVCAANQLNGFYMRATLGLNGLTNNNSCYFLVNTFNPFQANAPFLHPLKKKNFPSYYLLVQGQQQKH